MAQGHGQDNRLRIPDVCWIERSWSEQLGPHRRVVRDVLGRSVLFVVEATHGGCVHCCTIDDICELLGRIPPGDLEGLDTFLLRQPKRKERILAPVWGRLSYAADLGMPGRRTFRQRPMVTLEASDLGAFEWPVSLGPDSQAELARLRDDGHGLRREGRKFVFTQTRDSVRATQLYRTLLHEIGHWVDWLQKVERPEAAGAAEHDDLSDAYFARPKSEREAFAHRYADEAGARLAAAGAIPFARMLTMESLTHDGLDPAWFGLTDAP